MEKNMIVIGASAGGFGALQVIIADLLQDLDASILIVWHMSPDISGIYPEAHNKLKTLFAAHAVDRDPIISNALHCPT